MKVTNNEIVSAVKAGAFIEISNIELPSRVTLKLVELAMKCQTAVENFQKVHKTLMDKYTTKDEKGTIVIPKETEEILNEQFNSLLAEEIDLGVDKVVLPLTFRGEEIGYKAKTLIILNSFVEVKDTK